MTSLSSCCKHTVKTPAVLEALARRGRREQGARARVGRREPLIVDAGRLRRILFVVDGEVDAHHSLRLGGARRLVHLHRPALVLAAHQVVRAPLPLGAVGRSLRAWQAGRRDEAQCAASPLVSAAAPGERRGRGCGERRLPPLMPLRAGAAAARCYFFERPARASARARCWPRCWRGRLCVPARGAHEIFPDRLLHRVLACLTRACSPWMLFPLPVLPRLSSALRCKLAAKQSDQDAAHCPQGLRVDPAKAT